MDWLVQLILLLVAFAMPLAIVPAMILAERRICAFIQERIGPNLAGPFGLFQPLSDVIKLVFKEDFRPARADKWLHALAPAMVLIPAMLAFAVIPYGPGWLTEDGAYAFVMQGINLPVGLLFFIAVSAMGAYGIALGGWASNNKFAQLGGIRGVAQVISYVLTLDLALVTVFMMTSAQGFDGLLATDIAWAQIRTIDGQADLLFGFFPIGWNVFQFPCGTLAFVLFTIAAFAETNRLPFDLPEAEPELIGGYHTEYSGMRFGMFFLGEYIAMLSMCALIVLLFLGGWHFPGMPTQMEAGMDGFLFALLGVAVFTGKLLALIFFFMWVRWTFPRFRYDQLMNLGWKVMLPLALANLMLAAALNF